MSRGIGVRQNYIMRILYVSYPDYIQRNRLVYILLCLLNQDTSLNQKKRMKINKKDRDKLNDAIKKRNGLNKYITRDLKSLQLRKLIETKEFNNFKEFRMTTLRLDTYIPKNFRSEEDVIEYQNELVRLMFKSKEAHLLQKSRNFRRGKLLLSRATIKTKEPFKLTGPRGYIAKILKR